MGSTLTDRRLSREVQLGDVGRPRMARAEGRVSTPVPDADTYGLGERIWAALEKKHGSIKALCLALGEADKSQLRREVLRLNFAQFRDRIEDLAVIHAELQKVCAPLVSPAARLRQLAREQRQSAEEIDQLADYVEVAS